MAIHVIGVPMNHGTDKVGSNLGPDKFRELNIIDSLRDMGYDVCDLGNIEVADVTDEQMHRCDEKLKYYDVVIDTNTKLAFKAYESISSGNFPLILGGDHSLGMGSIAGISKYFKNIGVVWIDAHGDMNTYETTLTGNIHGMPLAASMGKGPDKLVNLFEHRIKVKEENVVHIAGRDLDPGEIELLHNSRVNAYSMEMVRKLGLDRVIDDSIEYLRDRVDAIHVSFDIDSMDSEFVPGTGTPVKNGLSVVEAKRILNAFASSGMMVSLDFVELNPLLDNNDKTANISIELLKSLFANYNTHINNQLLLG